MQQNPLWPSLAPPFLGHHLDHTGDTLILFSVPSQHTVLLVGGRVSISYLMLQIKH
jgi:hypothetical protein